MKTQILNSIQRVLKTEQDGISILASSIDDKSVKLVEICQSCTGKVVFTGMGKSGYIAKKISATMASLGTSSFFLHPAEAAHGDLGMLQANDVLIMVSNSGGTDELIQLISTVKIIGCKLVGIFCKENSILSEYCDMTIVLPVEKEAGINNLAPTTSTTVTLAYGDAIAVALSEINQFSEKDFALFHPRGTLGKKLLVTSADLCTKQLNEVTVKTNQTLEEVLFTITKNRLGAVAVTDESNLLLGIISDGDIRRLIEKKRDILPLYADEIMTRNPTFVKAGILAADTFILMKERKISVMPVVDDNNLLIGMLSLHDIITAGIA